MIKNLKISIFVIFFTGLVGTSLAEVQNVKVSGTVRTTEIGGLTTPKVVYVLSDSSLDWTGSSGLGWFNLGGCANTGTISKATFLAMLPVGSKSREFFVGLDSDDWAILSFDTVTRETCLAVYADTNERIGDLQVNVLSVTLPELEPTF